MGEWEEGVRREGKRIWKGKGEGEGRAGKGMGGEGRGWGCGKEGGCGNEGCGKEGGWGNEGCGKGKWDGDWWEQGQGLKPR